MTLDYTGDARKHSQHFLDNLRRQQRDMVATTKTNGVMEVGTATPYGILHVMTDRAPSTDIVRYTPLLENVREALPRDHGATGHALPGEPIRLPGTL